MPRKKQPATCICCLQAEAMPHESFCGACEENLTYNLPAAGWRVLPPPTKERRSVRHNRYNRYSEGRYLAG